jgi:hypothetical protein
MRAFFSSCPSWFKQKRRFSIEIHNGVSVGLMGMLIYIVLYSHGVLTTKRRCERTRHAIVSLRVFL